MLDMVDAPPSKHSRILDDGLGSPHCGVNIVEIEDIGGPCFVIAKSVEKLALSDSDH